MLRLKSILIITLGILIFIGACAQAQETLAVVNGDSITTKDVENIFSSVHQAMGQRKKMSFDYRKLVERLVNDRLMIQEAEIIGLDEESAFREFMEEEKRKNVIRLFVQDFYSFDQEVSDSEIEKFFDQNYHRIQVRTISVENRQKADSLREMLDAGAAMDSLAKLHSIDVHRYQGGAHSLKYYAEIENDLRAHLDDPEEGQLIGPIPYRQAFLLMRVEKIVPPNPDDLTSLSNYIRNILLTEKRKAHWYGFVDSLVGELELTRNDDLIDAIASSEVHALDSTFLIGSENVVATLGDSAVLTESRLRLRTAKLGMNAATAPLDSLVNSALEQWVQEEALAQSGIKEGLDNDPRILSQLAVSRDSALVELYLKETVVSKITFSREELTQYYEEHKDDFRGSGQLHLRRLIFYEKAKADSAYTALEEGGDFDYVMDRFVTEDRRLVEKSEWVSLEAFPEEIRTELDSLTVGDASRPIEIPEGWIIFKVLGREEGRLKTPEEVELAIREIVFQRQFNEMLDRTLALLKANSEIVYFDDVIDRYLGDSQ